MSLCHVRPSESPSIGVEAPQSRRIWPELMELLSASMAHNSVRATSSKIWHAIAVVGVLRIKKFV
jgi:hypothetical protein